MVLSFVHAPSSFTLFPVPEWAVQVVLFAACIVAVALMVQWSEVDWKAVRKRLLIGALLAGVVAVVPLHAFVMPDPCSAPWLVPWSPEWIFLGCWW